MRFRWRTGDKNNAPENILDAVEGLCESGRWSYMLALGKSSLQDPVVKAKLDQLVSTPHWYPRKLALMSSFASGDQAIILACLTGASGALTAMAAKPAARSLDDASLISALRTLPKPRLRILAKACARQRRSAVIESGFDRFDSDTQIVLAPSVSSAFLAERLNGGFMDRLSADDWGNLAARHPALICETFQRLFSETENLPHRLILSAVTAVWRMSGAVPRAALDLLRLLMARGHIHSLPVAKLAEFYPKEVAALVIAAPPEAAFHVAPSWLRALDNETAAALASRRHAPLNTGEFSKLPPPMRAHLYSIGALEHLRSKEGTLPPSVVVGLPEAGRHAEATRARRAPGFAAHPNLRLPYISLLPFEEALAEAKPFASQPDAVLRAGANAQIVAAARFDGEHFDETLDDCLKKKNEQDPVRQAMMGALSALPPSRWRTAHLPKLSAIIEAALAAADCSHATLMALTRLTVRLTFFHLDFVKAQLPKLLARTEGVIEGQYSNSFEGGYAYGPRFCDVVNDKAMAKLAPAFLEFLKVWRACDHNDRIFKLFRGLGPRLFSSPLLLDVLREMTRDKRSQIANNAAALLQERDGFAVRAVLFPALLEEDPSWVLTGTISTFLAARRQDLLPPFLKAQPYKDGRFATNQARVVAAFDRRYFSR